MKQLIDDVKSLVSGMSQGANAVRKAVADTRNRISELETELREILTKPLTKDDFGVMLLASVDAAAAGAKEDFGSFLAREASSSGFRNTLHHPISEFLSMSRGSSVGRIFGLLTNGTSRQAGENLLTEDMVYLLFRDQLKEGITSTLAGMSEWPFSNAQSARSYFPRIEEIEAELSALREQEAYLTQSAQDMGINLPTATKTAEMRTRDEKMKRQHDAG